MKTKWKTVEMRLKVQVPAKMPAQAARREVRSLVNDQCNFEAGYGDVRIVSCKPAPRS